jgi:DNA polymerase
LQPKFHLDYETFSRADLRDTGVYRYAEDASTDFTAVAYAGQTGRVRLWCPWASVPERVITTLKQQCEEGTRIDVGIEPPELLRGLLADPTVRVAAHNAQFERVVTNGNAGKLHNLPPLSIDRMICTMARAAVYGLPQALEGAAAAMGSFPKRAEGVNEMRYFSKPRKDGTRPTPTEEPDRYIKLCLYNIDDVKAERDLDHKVPPISAQEEQIYFLDQRINQRGVLVDLESVHNMRFLIDAYKEQLAALCRKATGLNPTQTPKLAEWIRANGYSQLPDLQAPTVVEALEDEKCPPAVREVLRTYSTYAMKAVSKYESIPLVACKDGRLRGLFRYYGAGPGRWSSSLVQLQNMLRPVIKDADTAIELAKLRSLQALIDMYDPLDPMKVIASCARGMLVAPEGKDFISFDFSQIEARIRSWLAGQEDVLEAFRTHGKIYELQGSKMFGLPASKIVDDGVSQLRTAAKIGDLACGFQGWEAAVEKMARQMGIKLTLPAVDIASRWREANPRVVRLWADLEDAAKKAVRNPGEVYAIPNKRIMFKVEDRWLYMRLPSGRKIAYLDPQCGEGVSYMGTHTYTRQWTRVEGYGGKSLQNATEGIGRDVLVNGLQRMEAAGYTTVATIHDQGLFEVDKVFGDMDEAYREMTWPLPWAEGLPVKADGWRGKRFRK